MATKLEKVATRLNADMRDKLTEAVREKFEIEVEHYFDIWGSMRLVTTRVDEEPFTAEQHAFIEAYSMGFGDALQIVRESR